MRPLRIVSLTDMLKIDGANMLSSASYVGAMLGNWSFMQLAQADGQEMLVHSPLDTRAFYLNKIEHIRDTAKELGLSTLARIAQTAFDHSLPIIAIQHRPLSHAELNILISHAGTLLQVLEAEARSIEFLCISGDDADLFRLDHAAFGLEVDIAFPAAKFDLIEAARCRATDRHTACVMHLMRALEVPLELLAARYEVPAGLNWNRSLNEIEAKLRSVRRADHGADEEQWTSEVTAHLRDIKDAWRNHAQHGRGRYSEKEAGAIWGNVRHLMQSLARRLRED